MPTFTDTREAKEFVITQIGCEAEIEGIPLSELERKMLYFSETAWSLPDIYEVNEAFELAYDTPEYEARIAALIRGLRKRLRKENPPELESWKSAVRTLKKEDHYLLVLIGIADQPVSELIHAELQHGTPPDGTPWRLKYVLVGITIGAFTILALIAARLFIGP